MAEIEALKIKTPYERHYLLLCLVTSIMVKVRRSIDDFFEPISFKDRIYQYCGSKVLRLIQIIKSFKKVTEPFYCPEKYFSIKEDCDNVPKNCVSCVCRNITDYLVSRLDDSNKCSSPNTTAEDLKGNIAFIFFLVYENP